MHVPAAAVQYAYRTAARHVCVYSRHNCRCGTSTESRHALLGPWTTCRVRGRCTTFRSLTLSSGRAALGRRKHTLQPRQSHRHAHRHAHRARLWPDLPGRSKWPQGQQLLECNRCGSCHDSYCVHSRIADTSLAKIRLSTPPLASHALLR